MAGGRTLALEGEIKGLRAQTAELEAALEGKADAFKEVDSEADGQRRTRCR
jgi:hypothetical protein